MRTSDFPSFSRVLQADRMNGFTLVEILVVLLIISILVGVTASRLPSFVDKSDIDAEARRLELLLNMARSEAALDSVEFGFELTDDGYRFLRFDGSTQRWLSNEAPYQARRLQEGLSLDLQLSSSELSFASKNLPAVLILSSGETTPVSLILESSRGHRRILKTDGYGAFAWLEDNGE